MAAWQMAVENLSIANMAEGEDYATPPAMARQLCAAISYSTPTVLSGARHLIPIESPEPIGAIPGLVIAALILRLPESSRWLIAKGRLEEAQAIVRDIEASTDKREGRYQPRRPRRPWRRRQPASCSAAGGASCFRLSIGRGH